MRLATCGASSSCSSVTEIESVDILTAMFLDIV